MSPAAVPLPAEKFEVRLEAASGSSGLSPAAFPRLAAYLAELDRWRRKINLTGALSADELVEHALESVAGQVLIPHGARVIDIGSGGGFPAIPLAIVRPDIGMTMLEPRGKRAAFLRHVARLLAMDDAEVLESSVEQLAEARWSVATTRALGRLGRRLGPCRFLLPSGLILAWTTEPEALAAALPAFALEGVTPLPDAGRRVIAALRKA